MGGGVEIMEMAEMEIGDTRVGGKWESGKVGNWEIRK